LCSGRLPHLRIFEGTVRALDLASVRSRPRPNDQTTRPQERPFKLVAENNVPGNTLDGQAPALRHTTKEHPTRAKPSQVESKQGRQGLSFRALTVLCYIVRFLPARRLLILIRGLHYVVVEGAVCDSIGARQSSPQQLRTELGIFFPRARRSYEEGGTSGFRVGGSGFAEFTEPFFKYLGSINPLLPERATRLRAESYLSNAGVGKRIKPASAAFGAPRSIFSNRHIDYRVKGRVESTWLYASASCSAAAKPGA
jgi:hypothetical protein